MKFYQSMQGIFHGCLERLAVFRVVECLGCYQIGFDIGVVFILWYILGFGC